MNLEIFSVSEKVSNEVVLTRPPSQPAAPVMRTVLAIVNRVVENSEDWIFRELLYMKPGG